MQRRRSRSRPSAEVQQGYKDTDWRKGKSNSRAVVDELMHATGVRLPVEDKYLKRLQQYTKQVLPMRYPTCPVGWERHTTNPKEAQAYGVAWVDADGYFCGPPGSDASTLYKPEDDELDNPGALNKRIRELTMEIKHTLNPGQYAEEIEEEKRKNTALDTVMIESHNKRKEVKKGKDEKMKQDHVRKLTKVYRDEAEANELYNQAVKCVNPEMSKEDKERDDDCHKITDNSNPLQVITFFVPKMLYVADGNLFDRKTREAIKWWKAFRRNAEQRNIIAHRERLSMYQ